MSSTKNNGKPNKDEGRWIFTPYITTKSGKRIWARWYGKKAFRIWVTT